MATIDTQRGTSRAASRGAMTFGYDSELFAIRDGIVIPAALALGKQHSTDPTVWRSDTGTYYPDGAAIETQSPPAEHEDVLTENLFRTLPQIAEHVAYVDPKTRLTLAPRGTVRMGDVQQLDETWGNDASLQILGCREDFNVWDIVTERPHPTTIDWRTIGHHFHAGLPLYLDEIAVYNYVSAYDLVLGITSVFDTSQLARLRRMLYGKAGTYRLPEYGIEYRTMPSSVVLYSQELFQLQARMFRLINEFITDALQNDIESIAALLGSYDDRRVLVYRTIEAEGEPDVPLARAVHLELAERLGALATAQRIQDILFTAENIHEPTYSEFTGVQSLAEDGIVYTLTEETDEQNQ